MFIRGLHCFLPSFSGAQLSCSLFRVCLTNFWVVNVYESTLGYNSHTSSFEFAYSVLLLLQNSAFEFLRLLMKSSLNNLRGYQQFVSDVAKRKCSRFPNATPRIQILLAACFSHIFLDGWRMKSASSFPVTIIATFFQFVDLKIFSRFL